MYSLWDYCRMIEDPVRTEAYLAALRQAITPGSMVVEVGTGTGFFAVMAVRMGAGRVYAIEADPAIAAAREVAQLAGCADRIEFIEAMSTEVTLPEQGDVLHSDLRGVLPAHQSHIPSIVDARTRRAAPPPARRRWPGRPRWRRRAAPPSAPPSPRRSRCRCRPPPPRTPG